MKKWMVYLTLAVFCVVVPLEIAHAYMIMDDPNDAIGVRTFEGYGIDVYNYTPGAYTGGISIDLFTNYPQTGLTVGGWNTQPADFFIKEVYYGNLYQWAIPLVSHDGFSANTMYAVGSYKVSDDFEPLGGAYDYNHDVPVRIATPGSNYGYANIGSLSVTWNNLVPPGSPDYQIHIATNIYQDDPNGTWEYLWGTATCANDVISSPVPEPTTLILFGSGLIALVGFWRKSTR